MYAKEAVNSIRQPVMQAPPPSTGSVRYAFRSNPSVLAVSPTADDGVHNEAQLIGFEGRLVVKFTGKHYYYLGLYSMLIRERGQKSQQQITSMWCPF